MKIQIKEEIGDRYPIAYRNEKIRAAIRKKEYQEEDIQAGCTPLDLACYFMQNEFYERRQKKALIPKKTRDALMLSMLRDTERSKENLLLYAKYRKVAESLDRFTKIITRTNVAIEGFAYTLNLWGVIWEKADADIDFLNSMEEGSEKERFLKHLEDTLPYANIEKAEDTELYEIAFGSALYQRVQEAQEIYLQFLKSVKNIEYAFESIFAKYPEFIGLIPEELCNAFEGIMYPNVVVEETFSYRAYRKKKGAIPYRETIDESIVYESKDTKYLLFPSWEDVPFNDKYAKDLENKIEDILNTK